MPSPAPVAPTFAKVPAQADFPAQERAILKLWEELDAFQESNRRRAGGPPFVFYDGPPFATGTPHYGHLLAGTIKDIVPRYWNMRGHPVARRFGWDCHGLPIEALAQQELKLAGTGEILAKGVGVFNEQCRSMVQTYVAEWRRTVSRMGRWVDFDNDYKTMDPAFMESVWWVFKQLWEQGRVYRSHRIMPYSWKLTTPLSNFEANSNYKDVQDPAITVRFRITSSRGRLPTGSPAWLLAWTTTPWTLPANLALCVGPDIPYVAVRTDDGLQILAEARLASHTGKDAVPEIVARFTGKDLLGWTYAPLFPYFKDQEGAFRVLADAFVSTGDGTGIVHLAPAYGEDDFRVCSEAGIALADPLDAEARFVAPVSDYAGRFCKDCDKDLIRRLKDEGSLVAHATIVHSYPFCERTDTPLIYRAIDAWYVKVADLRDDLVAANGTVRWVPAAVGANRFGNWLKDAKDWNISRNRFWGSCIPVWVNESDPADCLCVGSVAELEQLSGVRVTDLHKHHVDQVVIRKNGKTYRRTPEVLDCWFESGAMPYAQAHHPFSGRELSDIFPAHFIAEGLDQTRGWFYTLLVLGVSLFGASPYRNVIVNGLILAKDGKKMSKRLKNYPDPNEVLDRYGADALRAYLIDSPVVRGEELRFDEEGLKEIIRGVVLPFWNALSFFTTYAVVDGYDPRTWKRPAPPARPDSDRWLLSVMQSLIRDVNAQMEQYRLDAVVPRLLGFIDDLTNWYIRRNRARFWNNADAADRGSAYATLYEALTGFAQVLAPFMPFLTEEVHQRLVRCVDAAAPASIHWCDYPTVDASLIDEALEARMATARAVVGLGRRLREDHKLKVRQPLPALTVVHRDPALRAQASAMAALIADELNVKQVRVEADEAAFVQVSVKPNFKTLGKRCGPKLKEIGAALAGWGPAEVAALEAGGGRDVAGEILTLADVILQRQAAQDAAVATDGRITVVLDTRVDAPLRREGMARDAVSLLQNARKDAGLEVSDRIQVTWQVTGVELQQAISEHWPWIAAEVLATSGNQADPGAGAGSATVGDGELRWRITKD